MTIQKVKPSSVFKLFGTSKLLEKNGVSVNYGNVKFLVARAGGSNNEYADVLKAKVRPFRHQIDKGLLSDADDQRINAEIYAEAIIKNVQVLNDDETWSEGVPTEGGEVVPYTKANVVKLLLDLPDMFRDLRVCANDVNKYLKDQEEADLKNS